MLMTLVVVGLAGSVIASAVFSAFSDTTTSTGNKIEAGTVTITDNGVAAPMYVATGQKPGVVSENCITVTYDGTLPAAVKLYTPSNLDAGAAYVNLVVTRGTGAADFDDCTGFAADASGSGVYSGTLAAFKAAHTDYTDGLALTNEAGLAADWAEGEAVQYRFQVSIEDDDLAQGATSGLHNFVWEAQNS
jgi:predicted ribosomally synthesized peptide with SipW-like signal peptide